MGNILEFLLALVVAIVALLHIGFMLLEMVLWNRPLGRKLFGLSTDFAARSSALAANQGLYNGFLAAGLIWALLAGDRNLMLFFLLCVFVAGVFGALTVSRRIFWVQGFPALLGLLLLFQGTYF